jgi:sugar phosphate isomerase/epimerase
MAVTPIQDHSRLAIHTQTHKPWSLAECIDHFAKAGVPGISVWRNVIEPIGIDAAAKMIHDSGLKVPALVRGGFFPASDDAGRRRALDENRVCIDEAAAIGAEMVVLVVGAVPGMPLAEARKQVADGIAAVVDHADQAGVNLAIEPLHPMYAGDKSCINRMAEARDACQRVGHARVGIAVDVYHVWWDPDLEAEIGRAGELGLLHAFHVCDWRVPTRDLLTDRGLMGEGVIDIPTIRGWMEDAGFDGLHEVEIFSEDYWAEDQPAYLEKIKRAYLTHC